MSSNVRRSVAIVKQQQTDDDIELWQLHGQSLQKVGMVHILLRGEYSWNEYISTCCLSNLS
ncbi:hypothetical protein E4T43_07463 [Aureobasidium subglaciale]|nr:hypothetical protein E4T43_07463 [Aureobasidium subglaciale]